MKQLRRNAVRLVVAAVAILIVYGALCALLTALQWVGDEPLSSQPAVTSEQCMDRWSTIMGEGTDLELMVHRESYGATPGLDRPELSSEANRHNRTLQDAAFQLLQGCLAEAHR